MTTTRTETDFHEIGRVYGFGVEYRIEQDLAVADATVAYRVTCISSAGGGSHTVDEDLSFVEAMDAMRDAVAAELTANGCASGASA